MGDEDSIASGNDHVPEIVIRSEEEAWEALAVALVEGAGFPDAMRLRFAGWPRFELDIKGRDWHSTVPTRVMPALLDVQRDLNRAYANIQYQEPNLRRLREEERDELEIVVKVKEGSSLFDAELWEQFSRIAEAAAGRMNGNQMVITVLGVALTIMAPVMFKAWLRERQKEKKAANQVELSKEETERIRIITEAMRQQPVIEAARIDAEVTANKLLKATKPGDTMGIGGVDVSAEEARDLVQPEREHIKEIEIQGVFSILGNRTDKSEGFRITVRRDADQLTFNAEVPLQLEYAQQQIIQDAEWTKSKICLWIEAEVLRESIARAVVVRAAAVDGAASG